MNFNVERPDLEEIGNEIVFMQTEIDYYIGRSPGESETSTIIRIFGVNETGNSVMLHVHNFSCYFYIKCPASHYPTEDTAEMLLYELNQKCNNVHTVKKIEIVQR